MTEERTDMLVRICQHIKRGYGSGFPINEETGQQMSWAQWLDDAMAEADKYTPRETPPSAAAEMGDRKDRETDE